MKKALSLVLTLVMLISSLAVSPFGVSAAVSKDVAQYKLGDTFTVEYNSMKTKGVQYYAKFIPETTDYYEFAVDTHFAPSIGDGDLFTYIIDSKDVEINMGYDFASNDTTATVAAKLTAKQTYYFAMEVDCKLYKYTTNVTIQKHKHTLEKVKYSALYFEMDNEKTYTDGEVVEECDCGYAKTLSKIYAPKTFKLSTTSYTYNGKTKKPSVTVKDRKGNVIDKKYYTVTYPKGRKNVGKYTVTIEFKGELFKADYTGVAERTFTIKPKSTTISKVTAGKKAFTVKWKKQATQTTGYQIQYATDKKFTKNKKTVTVSKNKTLSKKITKLKAKKKYYIRVRTYKEVKVDGKKTKIYSDWSKAKTVKTK